MSGFTKILQKSGEYLAVKKSIEERRLPIGVIGLSSACKAHYISSLCEQTGKKALVLCPDEASALKAVQDLSAFSSGALFYPARDFHFRSSDSSSKEYEQQRIGVLSKMLSGNYSFIVCSVEAAMQLTVPKTELSRRSILVRAGDDLEESALVNALSVAGYVRAEQVDGEGQFSLRGGIIDFFPPGREEPVRIEFWGDSVDSISSFELESQRRTDTLDEVLVTPSAEVLFDSEEVLLEKIKTFISHIRGKGAQKIKATLSDDVAKIENGIRLSCLDRYLSLAYEKPETVFDYAKDCLLFVSESAAVKLKAESSTKLLLEDIKAMVEDGCLTKGLDKFMLTVPELFSLYERRGAVFADDLARGSFDVPVKELVSVSASTNSGWDGTMSYLLEDLEPFLKRKFTIVVMAGTEKSAKELAYDLETEGTRAHYYPVVPAGFPENSVSVVSGFVSASLTICVGAMAVIGPIQDALSHDYSTLFTKAVLDLVIIMVMASAMGKGTAFSVIPLAAVQGSITLIAKLVEPYLTQSAVTNISFVGSMMIFCVGVNLMFDKKIRVANMLPTIIFSVAFSFIPI